MSFKFGTEHVKDFDVILESTLYFSRHINYKASEALEFLGFIRFITNNSSVDIGKDLYVSLIKSKLQCTSVAWNNLTLKDSNKLKNIWSQFMCIYRRGVNW
jgi:hypothetical protein